MGYKHEQDYIEKVKKILENQSAKEDVKWTTQNILKNKKN